LFGTPPEHSKCHSGLAARTGWAAVNAANAASTASRAIHLLMIVFIEFLSFFSPRRGIQVPVAIFRGGLLQLISGNFSGSAAPLFEPHLELWFRHSSFVIRHS
jgi:hypothetical protein